MDRGSLIVSAADSRLTILQSSNQPLMAAGSPFDPDQLLAVKLPETTYAYTERDVALYALGVGACGRDAVDADELKSCQHFLLYLPPKSKEILAVCQVAFASYDPRLLLHGQQYIEIYKPFPSSATLCNKVTIAGLHDKGKAAVIEYETKSYERESGELLCMNRTSAYLRGAGGFSNSSQRYSYSNYPANQTAVMKIPPSQPFVVFEDCTQLSQALLYRLSGDYNPLHSDPKIAEVAGFSRPILHGLCTLGFAIRAVIKCICQGDANLVKTISARFLLYVYPGETLITEMWLDGLRVIYQTKVKERNRTVLSGFVDRRRLSSSL